VVAARSYSSTTASKLPLRMYDALQRRDDRGKMQAACRTGKYGRRHGDQLEQVPPAVKSPAPAFASLTRQHSACSSAIQNPSDSRTIEASYGCLVPRAHPSPCASRLISPLQIALFAVAAAAALVRFVQWKRLDESDRDAIWRLYGVFTFAAFVGSVCGVVTWSLYLAVDVVYIDALRLGATDLANSSADLSANYTLSAAFLVFKSLAFLFVSVAKLIVIDRMTQFAVMRAQEAVVRRMGAVQRVVLCIVLVVNVVAVAASLATTAYFSLAAGAEASASTAFSSNQTEVGESLRLEAKRHASVGNTCLAVAHTCNVCCLFVIMTTFAGAGVFVAVRIRHFLAGVGLGQSTPAARSARYLLLQTCITVAVVFATFLIRAAFETVIALGDFYNLDSSSCGICEPCQSEYYLIKVWINAVPEVQSIVIALAEPLTLLVALWGMTSERGARLLNRSRGTSGSDVAAALGARLVPLPQALPDGGAAAAAATL
jgi:hypothetical protein